MYVPKPEYVFLAAAKVGGIHANGTYSAKFLLQNLLIKNNMIDAANCHGASKLTLLGSSYIYPKLARSCSRRSTCRPARWTHQRMVRVAKIAMTKLCQAYRRQYGFNAISLMPTNLYGPRSNFDLANSHVLPALIRKFHGHQHLRAGRAGEGDHRYQGEAFCFEHCRESEDIDGPIELAHLSGVLGTHILHI